MPLVMRDARSDQHALPRSRWRSLKTLWYERTRPAWIDARPLVLGFATLAVLVLGVVGFQQYETTHEYHPQLLDSFYRTLTLFELDGTDVEPPIPWPMQIARFLAPVIVGYAIFLALIAIFRQQFVEARLRLLTRRHVVVAGLGGMGFRLACAFRAEGFIVVVIEIDEANGSIRGAHERAITVLKGDARDPRMLAKARVGDARYLIATCGDDACNVEVAVAAGALASAGVLPAFVHLEDAGLWRMLAAEAVERRRQTSIRLEFFNVFDTAARQLLEERPPFPAVATPEGSRRPHVLVAGVTGLFDPLVLNMARLWQNSGPTAAEYLRVTILDDDAEVARARLLARYPELQRICDVRAVTARLGVELQRGPLHLDLGPAHPVSAIFTCISEEASALEVALALRARPELQGVPCVVAVNDANAGVASLLREGSADGIHAFGVLDRALGADSLVRGTNELLAQAKHEEYVRHEHRRGGLTMGQGLLVPWEQLSEEWKDANRTFADGIGAQLETADCILVPAPLIDPDGPLFAFTPAEIETLAQAEHVRWLQDKLRNGWRYGPLRDDANKVHPLMVDWAQLPEDERDKDREPVREVPHMLARAGFEIVRRRPVAPDAEPALAETAG